MSKNKVAITMREIEVNGEKHNAIADSWLDLAELLEIELEFISSNDFAFLEKIKLNDYDALILSGGGDVEEQFELSKEKFMLKYKDYDRRQHIEFELIEFFHDNDLPILSVCRGMQTLNHFFGGKKSKVEGHLNVESTFEISSTNYSSFFPKKVICHHNYGIEKNNIANDFICTMSSGDLVEGMISIDNLKLGFMWHPERNLSLLSKDFINYLKLFFR
jgi:putative glutamine amidotransferase